jgi:hypothetical protein
MEGVIKKRSLITKNGQMFPVYTVYVPKSDQVFWALLLLSPSASFLIVAPFILQSFLKVLPFSSKIFVIVLILKKLPNSFYNLILT